MPERVEIFDKETIFKQGPFRIVQATLRHETINGGMTEKITRMNFERGDSAAVLIHNPDDDTLILIEQFRYPAYGKAHPWLTEIAAGIVDEGEEANEAARREVLEETGFAVEKLEKISTFFPSPGGSSERIHVFYASIDASKKIATGGGLPDEGEEIRNITLTVDEALQKFDAGDIMDGKTVIALQWLRINRAKLADDLKKQAGEETK